MIASDLKSCDSWRGFVLDCIIEKLQQDKIQVIIAYLDGTHLHVLARFPDHRPRHWIGRAKKNASHSVRQFGIREDQGGLWAKRSKATPITDRAHHLNTFGYILKHEYQGAAVWRCDLNCQQPTEAHA